jgi:hypothetical protein
MKRELTPQGNFCPQGEEQWQQLIKHWNQYITIYQNDNRINVQVMRELLIHTLCCHGIIEADVNGLQRKDVLKKLHNEIDACWQAANKAMSENQLDVLLDKYNETK